MTPDDELDALRAATADALGWVVRRGSALGVPDERVSRWSPLAQLHHAAAATSWGCAAIERILAGDPSCDAPGEPGPLVRRVLDGRAIPRGRAESPDALRPPPDVTPDAASDALASSLRALDTLLERSADVAAADRRVPHFLLGPMTPGQWIVFVRVHFEHHLALAREAAPPEPAA